MKVLAVKVNKPAHSTREWYGRVGFCSLRQVGSQEDKAKPHVGHSAERHAARITAPFPHVNGYPQCSR